MSVFESTFFAQKVGMIQLKPRSKMLEKKYSGLSQLKTVFKLYKLTKTLRPGHKSLNTNLLLIPNLQANTLLLTVFDPSFISFSLLM